MGKNSHSFSVDLAKEIGLAEALLLQHFYFWYQHARNLPDMCREGRVWFFRSVKEMREVFPYLSDANIRTAIQHLIDRGLVVKGDFSSASMYKATWYSLNDSAIQEFDTTQSQNPFIESRNGFVDSGKSISNKNKDNRKDSSKNNNINFDFRSQLLMLGVSEKTADAWLAVRKMNRAANTEVAFEGIVREINKTGLPAEECIRTAAERSWRGFKAEWMQPRTPNPQAPFHRQESIFEANARIAENIARSYQNNPYDEQ